MKDVDAVRKSTHLVEEVESSSEQWQAQGNFEGLMSGE